VDLYTHSPIRLHGVVLNCLSTETTCCVLLSHCVAVLIVLCVPRMAQAGGNATTPTATGAGRNQSSEVSYGRIKAECEHSGIQAETS
jgi:hypothetical protein